MLWLSCIVLTDQPVAIMTPAPFLPMYSYFVILCTDMICLLIHSHFHIIEMVVFVAVHMCVVSFSACARAVILTLDVLCGVWFEIHPSLQLTAAHYE